MLVCNVVGARPNFMKLTPVVLELKKRGIPQFLIHAGQQCNDNMFRVFFEELDCQRRTVAVGETAGSLGWTDRAADCG